MSRLFSPYDLKGVSLRNRIVMSPMCQYQADGDGVPNDWHFVHYVSRAIGGTGLIVIEMTDVEARGRITNGCLGLWNDRQRDAFARLVDRFHHFGAKAGIQLAHAGRKSTIQGNDVVAPSAVAFDASLDRPLPRVLEVAEIEEIVRAFGRSAALAVDAGFDLIELHGAHGYLIHQFMSPSSNHRTDAYADRGKLAVDVVREVRRNVPASFPLVFRVSATETNPDGYVLSDVLDICDRLVEAGVDAFDVSANGNGPIRPPVYPAYQAPLARVFKERYGLPTISVGRLENPAVAAHVVERCDTDLVMIGRGLLRNPYWARDAADALGATLELPGVYEMGLR